MAATATRMIAKFGLGMILRSQVATGTAWDPTLTVTDTTITGVVSDYNASEIDGTLVQLNDKKILIGSEITPTVAMKIVDGGEMSIVNVKTIKPGDTVVLYEVQAR